MPQLDPTPWFTFFIVSWTTMYILLPMKLSLLKKELTPTPRPLYHNKKIELSYPW